MASNPTVYCLQEITDYFAFERLCHDLMVLSGFPNIEPLGGFSDKGRDAVHRCGDNQITVFAYSVREDWRAKLAEDAEKIHKHQHVCHHLYFCTTAEFSAGQRDEAIADIKKRYGWNLELFGLERFRVLLDAQHPEIRANHTTLFPTKVYEAAEELGRIKGKYLYISCVLEDVVFAKWLAQKLTAEGYQIWSEHFNLLGGEDERKDVRDIIKNYTFRVVACYSQVSLTNPDISASRVLALDIGKDRKEDFLIPLRIDSFDSAHLDSFTRPLKFISFESSWADGLRQLLAKLKTLDYPLVLDGRRTAIASFLGRDVISEAPEEIFSNCLRIERIPEKILCFKFQKPIPKNDLELFEPEWAYRSTLDGMFLSFHQPPSIIRDKYEAMLVSSNPWRQTEKSQEIKPSNLVAELLRKSFVVKCCALGLISYVETTDTKKSSNKSIRKSRIQYFPAGLFKGNRLYYTKPDGSKTHINVHGIKSYWKPSGSEKYCYYLAPYFFVSQNLFDPFVIQVRLKIYLADEKGDPLSTRVAISRRKHLCQGWWNEDWFNRINAICQFLGNNDGKIVIGESLEEQIVVNASLFSLQSPVSINEDTVTQLRSDRKEYIAMLQGGDLGEDDFSENTGGS
jgi:TIR domain